MGTGQYSTACVCIPAGGVAQAFAEAAIDVSPIAPDFRHWTAREKWRRALRDVGQDSRITALEAALLPMPHDLALGVRRAVA